MCNILKFIQTSVVVLIPYLLTCSQNCFLTTLLTSYCVLVVFSVLMVFKTFNHFTWFSMGRIMKNDRCLIIDVLFCVILYFIVCAVNNLKVMVLISGSSLTTCRSCPRL